MNQDVKPGYRSEIPYMIKWDEGRKLLRRYPEPLYGGSMTSGLEHALEIACLSS